MKGRWFDGYLQVEGWESRYQSVQRLLDHLSRRTKSESSRIQYLQTLGALCRREGKNPDQLVRLPRHEAEDAVQSYPDDMAKHGRSKRWINVSMHPLVSFFRANGFKKQIELELERQYLPVRYRKRPEYIPLPSEINRMVVAGRNPSEKATMLFVYEGGLRNSTARAVRCAEMKAELDAGLEVVHVPVRSSMKEVDPDAAKGRVVYDPFVGREAIRAVKEHIGSMVGLFFGTGKVRNFRDSKNSNHRLYPGFHRAMLDRHVYLPPSAFETIFVSTAHSEEDIEKTVSAARHAFRGLAG